PRETLPLLPPVSRHDAACHLPRRADLAAEEGNDLTLCLLSACLRALPKFHAYVVPGYIYSSPGAGYFRGRTGLLLARSGVHVPMRKEASRLVLTTLFLLAITPPSFGQRLTESAERRIEGVTVPIPGPKLELTAPRSLRTAPQLAGTSSAASSSNKSNPGGLPGILSVPNFSRAFNSRGQTWPFTMMGNDPARGRRTEIPVRIVAVSLELQNEDLVTTTRVPVAPFLRRTLNSPNFRESDYLSGKDIQYADAVQRAEFFSVMKKHWHTELSPVKIVDHVTIFVPRTTKALVKDDKGNVSEKEVQTYFTGPADDGSTFVVLLDQFFDQAFFDTVANAIGAGRLTTDALNIVLLPNTFLFSVDQGPQGTLTLGFHTFL